MPIRQSLRADLTTIVQTNRVVLFMKGERRSPMCGFSATVVGILDELLPAPGAYETVNVLASPELRDGIKEFSDWPTIPQLYIDGKFVGGCDIVRDLHASGELEQLLGGGASTPAPTAARVTFSAEAIRAIREADPGDGDFLHLAIDPTYSHELFFGPREHGEVEIDAGGVTLLLDRASARRADGVSIDFVAAAAGGAAGFKIANPNEPPRVRSLSARELKALLDEGTNLELFDVRTDEEREIARIPGARPFDAEGQRALCGFDKTKMIVFQCHHGVRSRNAAERAVQDGYRNVYNLEGGIEAWSTHVDPTVPRY